MGQREAEGEANGYRGPLQGTHVTATYTPTAAVICEKKIGLSFTCRGRERSTYLRHICLAGSLVLLACGKTRDKGGEDDPELGS